MNPQTVLNLISGLMGKRKPSISGRWAVVYRDDNFMVLPVELTEPDEEEFGKYNEDDLTMGLSGHQWFKHQRNIAVFFEQKGL